uniref:Uncharacterized protein n=1 Tax=Ananas comosus var. bracteatus TaxID=296719 RepID=A0A6V7QML9_ANACO|nr:unnamed protein product [Ananas comosus var. bracteatus]
MVGRPQALPVTEQTLPTYSCVTDDLSGYVHPLVGGQTNLVFRIHSAVTKSCWYAQYENRLKPMPRPKPETRAYNAEPRSTRSKHMTKESMCCLDPKSTESNRPTRSLIRSTRTDKSGQQI